jgi:NAD(P)H-hydrate epimerase
MNEWTGGNTADFTVMTRQQVRALDAWAINEMSVPGIVLMENAARGATGVILSYFREPIRRGVCVFCGSGNNGGDGFAIARHLVNHRIDVAIALCCESERLKGDALTNFRICQKMNLPMIALDLESPDLFRRVEDAIGSRGLLVDAVLGTGMQNELKNPQALLVSCMNAHNLPIVAIDIPSGMDCDTGMPLPVCVEAAATVTMAALKKGFVDNPEARNAAGRIFVADIGILPAAQ